MRRLRGLKELVHDAVDATTHLVKEGHESTARAVLRVTDRIPQIADGARDVDDVRRLSTDLVLASVRVVNRAVEVVTNAGIGAAERATEGDAQGDPAVPMRSDAMKGMPWLADAAIGLVNGVMGDKLHSRKNALDLGMELRVGDAYVPLDEPSLRSALGSASGKVAVFVHGLGTTEWSWCLLGERYHGEPSACFGTLLERDLGYTPLFIRYNSGRRVSENGRLLSDLIESLASHYPVPLEELALFGHSMGGLVVRSACFHASEAGHDWLRHVRRVFCLASPHRGAPLEKFGHLLTQALDAIDLPGTQIPARILEARSAGIQDLRHGSLVDDDWLGRDLDASAAEGARSVPLLPNVRYHFISAAVTQDPSHPVGFLVGDLLVRVPSGSGPEVMESTFPIETACYGGVMHHELQNHPQVYEQIRACCARSGTPVSSQPGPCEKPSMGSQKYRLVTRSDFDGLVCAVLLKELDMIDDILFVHPKDMQDGKVAITARDISTNLPYVPGVHMAFDHHHSEKLRVGEQDNHFCRSDAPSAARVVYDHFGGKEKFPSVGDDLMAAVDQGDSAAYSEDEILNPKGWGLLNFLMDARTGLGRFREFRISNYDLMMQLIDACREHGIDEILQLPDVKERVDLYFQHHEKFKEQIQHCSTVHQNLVVLDLRDEETIWPGNRFTIYALFPKCNISIHVLWGKQNQNTVFAVGKSIIDRSSRTDIGELMLTFGGGGHIAAGTCQVENDKAEATLSELVDIITQDG